MSAELRCAGCGRIGEVPKIRWSNTEPALPPLHPRFGWHADGKPALLCPACEKLLARRQQTGRRAGTQRGTST
jgi:hypothetical protein